MTYSMGKNNEEIIMNYEPFMENRSKRIIDELDELDDDNMPLISSYRPLKKEKEEEPEDYIPEEDEWIATLTNFKSEPIKRRKSSHSLFDDFGEGKKKKKKKKQKGALTDYNSEFDKEMTLLKNLLVDQNNFTDSLQKKYNLLENSKSSQRGVGKFTTDLIESINSARKLSMDLVDKTINTKKTIADLTLKEKKEFGAKSQDSGDMGMYASNYLKEMMNMGRSNINSIGYSGDDYNTEGTPDDLFDSINDELGGDDRSEESIKYLRYEDRCIEIHACIDGERLICFKAYDKDGIEVPDYPLPEPDTRLNINRSTEIATDKYNNKYPIDWM